MLYPVERSIVGYSYIAVTQRGLVKRLCPLWTIHNKYSVYQRNWEIEERLQANDSETR